MMNVKMGMMINLLKFLFNMDFFVLVEFEEVVVLELVILIILFEEYRCLLEQVKVQVFEEGCVKVFEDFQIKQEMLLIVEVKNLVQVISQVVEIIDVGFVVQEKDVVSFVFFVVR